MMVVLPAPVWPDDGQSLAGLDAEGNVAQDPVFVFRSGAAVIGEPHVAKFDFAARLRERMNLWRARRS